MRPLTVVALGGHALAEGGSEVWPGAVSELALGGSVLVVHGNGPQVGWALRRAEIARSEVPELALDEAVAETQGTIGYEIASRLDPIQSVCIVTRVLVDPDDRAFKNPTKPIGSVLGSKLAAERERQGWVVGEDRGRGLRRLVASPQPIDVIDVGAIRVGLEAGLVVIAAGGGGIPVVEDESGSLDGIAAVIDKDSVASLLARIFEAERLLIVTSVPRVALDFGRLTERFVDEMSLAAARLRLAEGTHFGEGSMAPKVQAVVDYLEWGDPAFQRAAIITDAANMSGAIDGVAGTRFTK